MSFLLLLLALLWAFACGVAASKDAFKLSLVFMGMAFLMVAVALHIASNGP